MLSGNTDCYQPIERKEEITRELLKVFLEHKHPVGIITKNALVLRDLDILKRLAKDNLVKVNITITTMDEELSRKLEPRTSSYKNRICAVREMSENNLPVSVLMAPVIPGLNSSEIYPLFKNFSEAGAYSAYHLMVRLNGPIQKLFSDWLKNHYPDCSSKVLKLIKDSHGGSLNDSRFKTRTSEEDAYAKSLSKIASVARVQFFKNHNAIQLNTHLFEKNASNQLKLEL